MDEMDFEIYIPVWEGPFVEARERLTWLQEAHIPSDLGDGLVAGQARVEVADGYVEEAREIMREGPRPQSLPPLLDSPMGRVWKVTLAVVVIAALVFAFVL
jgi:hypothetical protein